MIPAPQQEAPYDAAAYEKMMVDPHEAKMRRLVAALSMIGQPIQDTGSGLMNGLTGFARAFGAGKQADLATHDEARARLQKAGELAAKPGTTAEMLMTKYPGMNEEQAMAFIKHFTDPYEQLLRNANLKDIKSSEELKRQQIADNQQKLDRQNAMPNAIAAKGKALAAGSMQSTPIPGTNRPLWSSGVLPGLESGFSAPDVRNEMAPKPAQQRITEAQQAL